jgi:hypothetical protein
MMLLFYSQPFLCAPELLLSTAGLKAISQRPVQLMEHDATDMQKLQNRKVRANKVKRDKWTHCPRHSALEYILMSS